MQDLVIDGLSLHLKQYKNSFQCTKEQSEIRILWYYINASILKEVSVLFLTTVCGIRSKDHVKSNESVQNPFKNIPSNTVPRKITTLLILKS